MLRAPVGLAALTVILVTQALVRAQAPPYSSRSSPITSVSR